MRKQAVPKNTCKSTGWADFAWIEWVEYRQSLSTEDSDQVPSTELNYWLLHFILEVRRKNGEPYTPHSLYQLICGLQRVIRETNPDWNLFTVSEFRDF